MHKASIYMLITVENLRYSNRKCKSLTSQHVSTKCKYFHKQEETQVNTDNSKYIEI